MRSGSSATACGRAGYRDTAEAVSQRNLDIVVRSFGAIPRRDRSALLELYGEDVTVLPLAGTRVESGGYRGHQGALDYFSEVDAVGAQMLPYVDDLRDVDETVVALTRPIPTPRARFRPLASTRSRRRWA